MDAALCRRQAKSAELHQATGLVGHLMFSFQLKPAPLRRRLLRFCDDYDAARRDGALSQRALREETCLSSCKTREA